MVLDDKDVKILRMLQENSRIPYNEIAKAVGLSDVAVIKRIKKLEKEGIIKKYTIVVDPAKLGYKNVSITGVNVEPDHLFNVIEKLKNKDYVKYLALTSGDHSLVLVIWGKDSSDIARIHREIEALEGVIKVYPAIVLDVIKQECFFY